MGVIRCVPQGGSLARRNFDSAFGGVSHARQLGVLNFGSCTPQELLREGRPTNSFRLPARGGTGATAHPFLICGRVEERLLLW